jgi:hypothetical protein
MGFGEERERRPAEQAKLSGAHLELYNFDPYTLIV